MKFQLSRIRPEQPRIVPYYNTLKLNIPGAMSEERGSGAFGPADAHAVLMRLPSLNRKTTSEEIVSQTIDRLFLDLEEAHTLVAQKTGEIARLQTELGFMHKMLKDARRERSPLATQSRKCECEDD